MATKAAPAKSAATAKRTSAKSEKTKKPAAGKKATTRRTPGSRTAAKKTKSPPAAAPATSGAPRRAVFIDVENTSSEADLLHALESLAIDRSAHSTEVTAVGNWRVVGQRMGRKLAELGAHLVHSAPALGVRDWSDLWIAVAAGMWLGTSAAGDRLDILSDDRAFDAVGDAAARRGVAFRRISCRTGSHAHHAPAAERAERGGKRRRRGRRAAARPAPVGQSHRPPPAPAVAEPHGAPYEQIVAILTDLSGGNPARWVNLDVLENALKAKGFARPPGSPRLVTRLRKLKDIEVSPHGTVRLVPPPSNGEAREMSGGTDAAAETPAAEKPVTQAPASAAKRRSRRRRHRAAAVEAPSAAES
jgi:hypothetical protein